MTSVLVVDDSISTRRLITDALIGDPDIRVIGTAPNGRVALDKLARLAPDLMILDIDMPVMGGLATLRALRAAGRKLPVVVVSTQTPEGAAAAFAALAAGASDFVTIPANAGGVVACLHGVRAQLIPLIHALCQRRPVVHRPYRPPIQRGVASREPVGVIAIGTSTGGPEALASLLGALPGTLAVPIVVAQLMPPAFTRALAARLDSASALRVVEARYDAVLKPGIVYVAPGGSRFEVVRRDGAAVARPGRGPRAGAIDLLFRSVATSYGAAAVGVVLTGIGSDGVNGAEDLRGVGAEVIVQDESTSVVWDLPGAVVRAGFAGSVLPLKDLTRYVQDRVAIGHGSGLPMPAL
jgi:two-component system chemotaxis response regulator CheB